ncbi:MAG: histidine phosphatase family protein [Actinomycetota bacterium]|nr:histidine phosphatase family protein [Actinomycetota bacterium]
MLIVVRHGRTEANATRRLQGRLDLPLDEVGIAQAAAVAARIGPVDRVVTSPLLRARQTGDAFEAAERDVDERIIEIDYGPLDGTPLTEVPSSVWESWRADPSWAPPGGESLTAVDERVHRALDDLAADAAERDVVVVSHVSPIKSALTWALGVGTEVTWRTWVAQAAIMRIAISPRGPVLQTFNETAPPVSG